MIARLSLVTVLCFGLIAFVQPTNAASPKQPFFTGTIAGKVTAEDTGQPLGNVAVFARSYTNPASPGYYEYSTQTKSDGTYAIDFLQNGAYRVRFGLDTTTYDGYTNTVGYITEWYDNQSIEFNGTFVTATQSVPGLNINAALMPGGSITGTVHFSEPHYETPAWVSLLTSSGQLLRSINVTPDANDYAFTGLQTGNYKVEFYFSGYVTQYYNDQFTPIDAHLIHVTAPAATPNVNATLRRGGSIAGVITSESTGLPISGIRVSAIGPHGSNYTATSDQDGNYKLTRLPDGHYRVSFDDEMWESLRILPRTFNRPNIDPFSPDVVTISGENTANVNAALEESHTLSVTFLLPDYIPPNAGSIGATISQPCINTRESHGWMMQWQSIRGLRYGTHQLQIKPSRIGADPPWAYYYTDEDVYATLSPQGSNTITVPLKIGGGIIGFVEDESGQGVIGASITVTGNSKQSSIATSSTSMGLFLVAGLTSGTYTLTANDNTRQQNGFLPSQETTVTLNATETVTASAFVLARGSQISGKLAIADGAPLAGANIVLSDASGNAVVNTLTGRDGTYVLRGIGAGTYLLRFNAPLDRDSNWYTVADGYNGYLSEYYDDQASLSTAKAIIIPASSITLTEVNAAVSEGGRIAGKVVDSFGIAMPGVFVSIYDLNNRLIIVVVTDGTGRYITSPGLPAGQYKVRFDYTACNGISVAPVFYKNDLTAMNPSSFHNHVIRFSDATPVTVELGKTTYGIDATLMPDGFTISGRVTNAGNPAPGFKLTLSNGSEATTDSSGYYTFTAVYTGVLTLAPAAGMAAALPVLRNITVGPNAVNQDFSLIQSSQTYTISGRVLRNGAGIKDFKLNVSNGLQMTTDAHGRFTVSGLSTGVYTITPATGQGLISPASHIVTLPPNTDDNDFVTFQVMTPVIVK